MRAVKIRFEIQDTAEVDMRVTRRLAPRKRGVGYATPYVLAEIKAVHEHGCACTRWGKKRGPCNCGGWELFAATLRRLEREGRRS